MVETVVGHRRYRTRAEVLRQSPLDGAVRLLGAARKSAEDMGVKVTIAVLDPRGDLIALHRIDEALWRSVPISHGKAAASAACDAPSGDLRER